MPVSLTVGGVIYSYPVVNSEIWGSDATDWAVAVSNELSAAVAIGDIGPNTLVTINNNQVAAINVTNAVIDPATLRAAVMEYYVHRTTDTPIEVNEVGSLYCIYDDTSSTWSFAQTGVNIGGTGVTFSINPSGNVQYTSSNLSGGSYSGLMKFRVRALQKT